MDYKTQAKDVLKFMKAMCLEKVSFVGHSIGAKSAMPLALSTPDRVEKLCIMDMAPISYKDIMEKYYEHIRKDLQFIKNTKIKEKTRKEIERMVQSSFEDINITHLICRNLKILIKIIPGG